jgi:hypothetical protein
MSQADFLSYALVVLVLILAGINQFRSDRRVGVVMIVIGLAIAFEIALKAQWIHLPNVFP